MQALLDTLQNIGIFLAFLAARFALLLVVLAVLTVVFLAGLLVVRAVQGARRRALGLTRVDGLLWRAGVYYAPGHAWLQWREGSTLRIGLDDLAQHLLSQITEVMLPQQGQMVRVGEPVAVIRCGRRRATLPAPVDGKVVAINRRLVGNPSRLHNDPYAGGWLYAVEPSDTGYTRLPYGQDSKKWFSTEAIRLSQFLEHQLGMAAADGGELVAPGPSLLTEQQWEELTQTFLQSPK
ncbi:MAG TPA: glycine cleavage system protein H [Vicinamibacterales bacterium]|jgi:glycine cleavage system H lipoate-binding protein